MQQNTGRKSGDLWATGVFVWQTAQCAPGRPRAWPGAATVAHRVVNGRGFLSGAGAFLFDGAQRDLLESEGVMVSDANTVDLQRYGWSPSFEGRTAAFGFVFRAFHLAIHIGQVFYIQ